MIERGEWHTDWAGLVTGHAALSGELDCTTGAFHAVAVDSVFTIAGIPSGSFTLDLAGAYDRLANTLQGTYVYTSNAGNGDGTWHAAWVP